MAASAGEATGRVADEGTWNGLEGLRGSLRAFLSRHSQDESEVEDVIQETYLRAVRYRERLSEPERLASWTMRIARNVLADRRRRERRYVARPEEPEPEAEVRETASAGDSGRLRIGRFDVEVEEAVELLRRSLRGLSEEDRRLLGSFYEGEESCRRTAEECAVPARLVKVRLFRARQRLCRAMRHRIALEHANPNGHAAAVEAPGERS